MEQGQIISAIETYLDVKPSDYAVMITGEWGSGKTYLLNNEIKPIIGSKGYRYIYISLIGLNSEEKLSRLILERINPFYHTVKKSQIACEADALNKILNAEKIEELADSKIVLCFDDLERIKLEFFETAMGYINTFIEHQHVKCIFLCNEEKLTEFKNYKEIKEKYVRFSFLYSANIHKIAALLKPSSISEVEIKTVADIFFEKKCDNIRTLIFVLSTINEIKDKYLSNYEFQHIEKEYASDLIVQYCSHYSIAFKNGENKKTLDDLEIDKNKFQSIGDYIQTGYFNNGTFREELTKIDNFFFEKEQRKHRANIMYSSMEPFRFSDDKILDVLNSISIEVEKGIFSLDDCLTLYWNLLRIESRNLKGFEVADEVTGKFKKGAMKYIERFDPDSSNTLARFLSSDVSEKGRVRAASFKDYIVSINDALEIKEMVETVDDVLKAIVNDNEIHVYDLLVMKKFLFFEKDAIPLFEVLMKAHPKTTNKVKDGLKLRYSNEPMGGGAFSVTSLPEKENKFILSLYDQINYDTILQDNIGKPLSKIYVYELGQFLKNLIVERKLE